MTQLSFTVKNAQLVRMGLQNLDAEIPKIGKGQIYNAVTNIAATMRIYPPQPAGSKYKRTFVLQRSWTVEAKEKGYAVKSDAARKGRPYTKYVVGTAWGTEQAGVNAHWNLLRDVAEKEIAKLPPAITNEISMAARRNNL